MIEATTKIEKHTLSFQTGKLAKSATSSVLGRLGDTCVLVTVTIGREREDIDWLPLQVEYVEKLYAGGRIKGSRWVKREGRPSDDAILKGRIIDRSIRPLFPKGYKKDTQIVITLLSIDGINPPEILSAITVSAALAISPIPWKGPISTMRVGYVTSNGSDSYLVYPTQEDEKYSTLNLIVSSTKDKVIMIEHESEETPEDIIIKAIQKAKIENLKIITFIEDFVKKAGKQKIVIDEKVIDEKLQKLLKKDYAKKLEELNEKKAEKEFEDKNVLSELVSEIQEKYSSEEFEKKAIEKAIDYQSKQLLREKTLKTKKRVDGRGFDDVRTLSSEVSVLPRTHGSSIFQRGDTQVLSIVTLGAPSLEQLIEGPEGEEAKRYIHHYYMPPYSVGETGRIGFPSRREIGHGALAEKAVEPVLPSEKDFPYTIRVVSEVLSSNGSTSQASACASALALMDAGVPISSLVAGIAMGMFSKSDKEYAILTDIMGIEDFSGDMDFKIAGTENGITALQLDVKNEGLTDAMIKETFSKAHKARFIILENMKKAIQSPRKEISKYAPKVVVLTPPQDKIGEIIGPGGKNIRALITKTETDINISDDGKVTITGLDKAKVEQAVKHIENMTRDVQVGEEFVGEVKRIMAFGAFVEVLPGKEGLVHVSKMGKGFVKDASKVVQIGQKVRVKVYQIDQQGRINLQLEQ